MLANLQYAHQCACICIYHATQKLHVRLEIWNSRQIYVNLKTLRSAEWVKFIEDNLFVTASQETILNHCNISWKVSY